AVMTTAIDMHGCVPLRYQRRDGNDHSGSIAQGYIVTTTRPEPRRASRYSCASATSAKEKRWSILKRGHLVFSIAFRASAASAFASTGKSSLPRKKTRMFLKTSGRNGISGVAFLAAYAAREPPTAKSS